MRPWRSAIPFLIAGLLPFAVGALLPRPGEDPLATIPCPFRELTGLPCPLCGSTRAVILLAHGDPGFTAYNLVVPLVLIALALAGAWLVAGRRLPRVGARGAFAAVAVLAVLSWAWTLAHRATIVT